MRYLILTVFLAIFYSCQSYNVKKFDRTRKIAFIRFDDRKNPFGQLRLVREAFKQQILSQYGISLVAEKDANEFIHLDFSPTPKALEAVAFVSQDNRDGIKDNVDESFRVSLFKKHLKVKLNILNRHKKIIKSKIYKSEAIFTEWHDLSEEEKQALKLATQRLVEKIVNDL